MKKIENKKDIPRIILYSAFILIFISLFLPRHTSINVTTGYNRHIIGYESVDIIIILILSTIPIISFELKKKLDERYLIIPIIEFVILTAFQPLITPVPGFTYEIGPSFFLVLLGILIQLIGVITTIKIGHKNKLKTCTKAPPSPPPSW